MAAGRLGEPRDPANAEGPALPHDPNDTEAILRPLKNHHKMAVFTFIAKRARKDRWGNAFERGKRYPVTYWGIQTARRRDFAKAETGMVGFHDLRRTAAKRMDKAVGEEAAQKMLGHGSIKTTRIYLRKDTDVEKLRAQMEARDADLDAMRAKARGETDDSLEVGVGTADGRTRALATLRDVGLEDRRNDWPSALSGGSSGRPSPAR